MREPTIPIYFIREVLWRLRHKAEHEQLLRRNNIAPALLANDAARVQASDYANLVRDTMLLMEDESLGLGSGVQPTGSWDIMCHSVIGTRNLGEAWERLCRFYRLFDWGVVPELTIGDDISEVSLSRADNSNLRPYLFESFLFYIYRFGSWLLARQIPLQSVQFHFGEPAEDRDHYGMFFSREVHYRQARSGFRLASHFLQMPLRRDHKDLKDFLKHPNRAMLLQQYNQQSWQFRVQQHLAANLCENPGLPELAAALNLHPQSLRRRLQAEGFQFQQIKDRVRRDTAIFLLSHELMSIEDIALETGFSESSAFIRAFRQWTGVTPHTYRKQR